MYDYQTILKYALFSRLSYADYDITIQELKVIGDKICKVAFIDIQSQVWIFKDDMNKELIIAFRGSDSLGDIIANFNIIPGSFYNNKVHRGYLDSYMMVRNSIMYHVMEHIKVAYRQGNRHIHSNSNSIALTDYKITVTGHSLGGMCACLCALELGILTKTPVSCYTFGAPPGGDRHFYEVLERNTQIYSRVIHAHDFAPNIPMMFYHHCNHPVKTTVELAFMNIHDHSKSFNVTFAPEIIQKHIRHHTIDSYIGVLRRSLNHNKNLSFHKTPRHLL